MCGLQFSVQLPQGGELACDRVDADGTVLVQDGVSEEKRAGRGHHLPRVFSENRLGRKVYSALLIYVTAVRTRPDFALWFIE